MSECWLYRIWNGEPDGLESQLLYVGISDSPSSRMANHESQKWWWWISDNVTWQRYSCREEAKQAETEAIQNEWPLFNIEESRWNNWERLESIVKLAFQVSVIETNTDYDWFNCPFCVSRGGLGSVSLLDKPSVFIRRDDDHVVLSVPVCCANHSEPIAWAEQRKVESLLRYAKCSSKDAHDLLSRAILHASGSCFESRATQSLRTLEEHLEMSVGVMNALQHQQAHSVPLLTHADLSAGK
jgi:predicted GIY-YIG superfamily endonuclease